MDSLQIIFDNENAVAGSFMYCLHEKNDFDMGEFKNLCQALRSVDEDMKNNKHFCYKIHFIYTQILYHILCHFNTNDFFQIENLSSDFNEHLDELGVILHRILYHES